MAARVLTGALAAIAMIVLVPVSGRADVTRYTCDRGKRQAAVRYPQYHRPIRVGRLVTIAETRRMWIAETGRETPIGHAYVACWKPSGRARLLGTLSGGADVSERRFDLFTVAAHYVAFHLRSIGDENFDRVSSVDVRTGHVVRDTGKIWRSDPATEGITAVVVTSRGAIAWQHFPDAPVGLYARDAEGTRVLAPGLVGGLDANGRTVHWTENGLVRSARLH